MTMSYQMKSDSSLWIHNNIAINREIDGALIWITNSIDDVRLRNGSHNRVKE